MPLLQSAYYNTRSLIKIGLCGGAAFVLHPTSTRIQARVRLLYPHHPNPAFTHARIQPHQRVRSLACAVAA